MIDSVVKIAIEKLSSILQDEMALLVGVTDEIEKLSSTFTFIQAVLKDAETRRVKDEAVKIWLEKVKDVAYDVDDILDEWTTDALRSQAPNEADGSSFSKKKVRSFLSPFICFNNVKLCHNFGIRIKELRGRLDDIAKEKDQLSLGVDREVRQDENSDRETGSLLNRPSIVGRECEKNEVVDFLLRVSSGEVNEVPVVISIIGMGGLGKTTLAQLAYNDEKVKKHFDLLMWVCVSEDFDVKRITKSIIESATESGCAPLELDQLQRRLCKILHVKRFLLVLDDIWSDETEKWDKLRLPFQAGALGSRIVITTRSEGVAMAMGTNHMYKLAVLSKDDCLLLFNLRALEHRSAEERSELEEIGREIIKKCGGVPLAAKTLGSAMRFRRTRSQWVDVLGSDIWNSGDILGSILPALLLSYLDLPPALKQCFAYFSIFSKDQDREIRKENIVKLWMAQGFIDSSGSGDMEETGDLYFDELLRRSLLQDAEMDAEGNIYLCKMHDLVHDLAQFVAGSDCSIVVIRQQATLNLNNARHSLLCFSDEAGEVPSIPATLYKAHKLRTLLLDCRPFESRIFRVPHNLFHQLRCLRALNLSYTDIVKLPGTIGQMNHLRHLDLSYTGIEELPEEVSNCINLQALILNGCHWLRKLPSGMRKMISLRLLEFHNCYSLRYLPQGIGKLTALRKITKFIVGSGDKGCKCGELKHLNHLQGELEITGLENVRSRDDCREAELDKKQHLRALYLRYPYEGGEPLRGDEMTRMDHVLQSLQPHKNLKWFQLWNYQGSKFPKWIENPMFSNLVTVRLNFCGKCKQLPGLGKLPSLKYLYIYRMNEVTYVSGDFSGNNSNDGCGGGVLFPKLETLSLTEMPKWKEWELRGGDGQVMPSLIELELHNCRKLKVLHCNLLPLQKLTLDGINEMVLWRGPLPVLPNLNYLEILNIDELSSLPGGWLGQLKALQTLKIENCPQLGSLPEELGQLKALQTLKVENCPQLRSLPEELGQLEALQTLKVENCPQLGSLPEELGQLKALQNLQIENCTQVGTLPKELGQLKALQTLKIENCPQLGSLPEELGQLKALQTLTIFKCQELRSLPVELEHLTMLQQLEIYDCQKLNPLPRNLSPLLEKLTLYKINNEMLLGGPLPLLPNLKNLVISNIDDLTSLPGAWLGQLKALQTLEIKWCPQLGSLPEELQLLTMLRELKIVGCPDLEERCQDGGEDWDKIAHIPHIKFSHF